MQHKRRYKLATDTIASISWTHTTITRQQAVSIYHTSTYERWKLERALEDLITAQAVNSFAGLQLSEITKVSEIRQHIKQMPN